MSGYVPKVGDKVRAVLGENVLVGELIRFDDEAKHGQVALIKFDGTYPAPAPWLWVLDGWQFEQVVSVPSKFGAVIRRADGKLFSLRHVWWPTESDRSVTVEEATRGGFTIEFDGADS